eukprot:g31427.t1
MKDLTGSVLTTRPILHNTGNMMRLGACVLRDYAQLNAAAHEGGRQVEAGVGYIFFSPPLSPPTALFMVSLRTRPNFDLQMKMAQGM